MSKQEFTKGPGKAHFEPTQIEVGTGEPGYKWVDAYFVIGPDGSKYYPPMVRREAIAFCKANGWDHSALTNRTCSAKVGGGE